MRKLFLAAALAVSSCAASPAYAWEVGDVNKAIDQTNFVVNENCSGTLIDLQKRHILTAEHCINDLTITVEEDEHQPDGTVKKVKRYYRKPLEVRQATYNEHGDIVGSISYRAKIVGSKKDVDLALLQVEGKLPSTYASSLLPIFDKVQRGEVAWIVGNPMGMEASITRGIVSHVRRELRDASGPERAVKFTQIDGGASPGNSGGAVYNDEGLLIGVLVRGYPTAGHLSFAVSIEDIRKFVANPTSATASEYEGGPNSHGG